MNSFSIILVSQKAISMDANDSVINALREKDKKAPNCNHTRDEERNRESVRVGARKHLDNTHDTDRRDCFGA